MHTQSNNNNSHFSTLINSHANSHFSTLINSHANSHFSTLINSHANSRFSTLLHTLASQLSPTLMQTLASQLSSTLMQTLASQLSPTLMQTLASQLSCKLSLLNSFDQHGTYRRQSEAQFLKTDIITVFWYTRPVVFRMVAKAKATDGQSEAVLQVIPLTQFTCPANTTEI
jgi:lantibiotic modifying enzyme